MGTDSIYGRNTHGRGMRGLIPFLRLALLFLSPVLSLSALAGEGLTPMRALIDVRTGVSDGTLSVSGAAEVAEEKGVDAVVFTDRDFIRCEYGLPPFRQFLKKRMIEKPAVFTYGIERYLEEIKDTDREFPDTLLVPGIRTNPYYWWEGTAFRHDLKLRDWHRHMVVIGMTSPEGYRTLPVLGNPDGSHMVLDPAMLWPFLLLLPGLLMLCRKAPPPVDESSAAHAKRIREWQKKGAFLVLLAVVVILLNWPFTGPEFDQYADAGSEPYQRFVDKVNENGGLSYWANPEASGSEKMGEIRSESAECIELMQGISGYTGFAVFPSGYRKVGTPGGVWDKMLNEYCDGTRESPVWTIALTAYAGDQKNLARAIASRQTVVLVDEESRDGFVKGLRRGRAYAMQGRDCGRFHLEHFGVSDASGGKTGFVGDTVKLSGNPIVRVEGRVDGTPRDMELRIIRNGRMIRRSREKVPFKISHEDTTLEKDKETRAKLYYRVEIREHNAHVITNPVFVTR